MPDMQNRLLRRRCGHVVWQALVIAAVFASILRISFALARKSEDTTRKQKSDAVSELKASQSRTDAYYHFSLARGLEEEGKFTQALEEYRKAIQQDPQSSD